MTRPLLDVSLFRASGYVSSETVKVFRKRIHHKLNIHSQGELFSRLLASLTMITSDHIGDPLVLLRQNPKKQ